MKRLTVTVIFVAACLGPARAAQEEFRIVRLGTNVVVFQIGKETTTDAGVLATRRGLVVVDTGVLPSRGAALRTAIERVLASGASGPVRTDRGRRLVSGPGAVRSWSG